MKALLIEDDYYFAEEIVNSLAPALPDLQGHIEILRTEKDFRDRLTSPEPLEYQFIILDIMLKWGEQSGKPDEVVRGGYFVAGIRCLRLLRAHSSTAQTPVIIHSARDPDEIRKELRAENVPMNDLLIVSKSGDPAPLVEWIKSLLPSPLPSGKS